MEISHMVVSKKITSLVLVALGALALMHFQTSETLNPPAVVASADVSVDAVPVPFSQAHIEQLVSEAVELDYVETESNVIPLDTNSYTPEFLPLPAIADRLWREDDVSDALEDSMPDSAGDGGAQSLAWTTPMPAGYKSVILEFENVEARKNLAAKLDAIGGQVVHQYHHMPFSTVRVPEHVADQIAGMVGAKFAKADEEIVFASDSSKGTMGHPLENSGVAMPVSGNFGVAVLDSGVDDHSDLNVDRHVNFTVPFTDWSGSKVDRKMTLSYIFDEDGGTTVFDRAIKPTAAVHMTYLHSTAGKHPESIPSSVMRSTEDGIVTELDLQNNWSQDVVIHLINENGKRVKLKKILRKTRWKFPSKKSYKYSITDSSGLTELAVITDQTAEVPVQVNGPLIDWDNQSMSVRGGGFMSAAGYGEVINQCALINRFSLEALVDSPGFQNTQPYLHTYGSSSSDAGFYEALRDPSADQVIFASSSVPTGMILSTPFMNAVTMAELALNISVTTTIASLFS